MKIFKPLTAFVLAVFCLPLFAASAPGSSYTGEDLVKDSKQTVTRPDMYNRVHRAGLFWLNVTNRGYFGNPSSESKDPCTGKIAVSGELPGGSGTDFLFVGSLMFGGYLNNGSGTNGGTTFIGPLVSTGYEGWTGEGGPDDMAKETWPIKFADDPSGKTLGQIYESSNVEGRISCLFEEVYDPLATAEEQFGVMYTDKYVDRTYTGRDDFDRRDHQPLGIEIRQKSYAWSYDYAQKFVIIDYTLYNKNEDLKDIYNFFMGVYLDCDIGHTSGTSPSGGVIQANHGDDIGGFIQKWDKYIDPATGQQTTVDLNLAWAADNDGRNYIGAYDPDREPGAGQPLDGATSIATVRVLRNPNPNLRYAFNMYVADSGNESIDWGPRWQTGLHPRPVADHAVALPHERRDDVRARPWLYDLTLTQRGYDDYNEDGLLVNGNNGPGQLYGGRTEGRPSGDKGRYMVMSNDEFDYDQTSMREVHLGQFTDPPYAEAQYQQATKWQRWTTAEQVGLPDHAEDIPDGTVEELNDLANGRDVKYFLSFGPLGTESTISLAWDSDNSGDADAVINNKKVWRFAHGDSLKLTLAFIVNENFHTSLDQDPNYADHSVVDLTDGLDPALFSKGWYDALYNVVWAERVYDIPMFDTYITKLGETKGDGWYGEDVGADAMFGDLKNDTYCWWYNYDPLLAQYTGPDDGEGDFKTTTFTTPMTDIDGWTSSTEDLILPYGRKAKSADNKYGITGDAVNGDRDGYGYMVKNDTEGSAFYDKWIRFGFGNGKCDVGDGVPDFTGPPPPPSPKTKVTFNNNDVIIEWQSHEFFDKEGGFVGYTGPEIFIDPFTRSKDFEGYQIQISPDVNSQNYVEVFSVDKTDYVYENVRVPGEYLDAPFETDSPDSLDQIITEDGKDWQLKPYGNNSSMKIAHSQEGIYTYTAVSATRTINIDADTTEDVVYWNYKFIMHNKLYAKQNYIAVTASDFGDPKTGTPPLKSNPSINGTSVIPTKVSGTKDVYVVPNPYRGDEDYEAMGWENTDQSDLWQEQDRKIVFMNVPLRSVLKIYTLAGDLVKTIGHNGNTRVNERYQYGEYGISWDLINENNQAVVSGIYLYSVQDVDDDGYEQVGKFVIIK